MRSATVVALMALSPMLLHAQANSPAKTQSSADGQVLQSKLAAPKGLTAPESTSSASAPTSSLRISTGVTPPKLISTVEIASLSNTIYSVPAEQFLVVSMIVDTAGKPQDLKIVKSAGQALDQNVIAAVSQYRFKPGSLNNEPTAVPLNLEITVQHAGR